MSSCIMIAIFSSLFNSLQQRPVRVVLDSITYCIILYQLPSNSELKGKSKNGHVCAALQSLHGLTHRAILGEEDAKLKAQEVGCLKMWQEILINVEEARL